MSQKTGEMKKPLNVSKESASDDGLDGYKVIPLTQRSLLERYDVGPFVLLYLAIAWVDRIDSNDQEVIELCKLVAFPLALMGHLVAALLQQWRVSVECTVGYRGASLNSLKRWTHCLVTAPVVGGKTDSGIVEVRHQPGDVATISFHDVVFRACASKNDKEMDGLWIKDESSLPKSTAAFHRLRYPTNLSLSFYPTWKGHENIEQLRQTLLVYGENTTHIQLPPFFDLLGQQLLAPFFLFQLFCVVLWSLDEYWYYAIFTLFALLMFECTVAYNRLKGLQRLRGTLRHAYSLFVYRRSRWSTIPTDQLLPGDIVSLTRRSEEIHVPADLLLLRGTAVVDEALLTGESIPQLKGSLDISPGVELDMQEPSHKQSILFGGTMLVSHDGSEERNSQVPSPPDKGAVCLVLKTGFETAQGSLLRSMAHSSMKSADGIHTEDTFVFVGILLVCAVLSAISVFREGWQDETRNQFRLVLHVIIIVTSVVPPELPMELSLAVTNSVADLMKRCNVYCTEPYRIPWAGQVETCCFDKTGTLTSDEMQLKGVRLPNSNSAVHPAEEELPWTTLRVMAACHSLASAGQNKRRGNATEANRAIIGDSLEKAVLKDTGFSLRSSNFIVANSAMDGRPRGVMIHHRFAFSSRLKRMSVLLTEDNSKTVWSVSKGAPETVKGMLLPESIPTDYDDIYLHHMGLGQRVLAMGYRNFGEVSPVALKESGRDVVETGLIFAGFLILDCPLKPDSKSVIKELRQTGHETIMITGDAVLTAAEVARQVGIISKESTPYELIRKSNRLQGHSDLLEEYEFVPLRKADKSNSKAISISKEAIKELVKMKETKKASFCVTGSVLADLAELAVKQHSEHTSDSVSGGLASKESVSLHPAAQKVLKDLVTVVSVFARHAPKQKEAVVAAYNLGGKHTLMCGDGTNDVGALKRAHVGISIVSAPELESKHRNATERMAKEQKRERKARKEGKVKKKKKNATLEESLRQLQEAQQELDHVELGDASVASPFTSRAMSIKCCKDVLQQGRCTLVTMLTIYKILGVNSLVNALVLTKLFAHGVKQGDQQLTILGMAVAAMFLFVTRGKPLSTLAPTRPPSSVLCASALFSITVQFAIHLVFILLATEASLVFVDPYDPSIIPDAAFNPNVLNSCTFLLTMTATINTFVVNYRGKPFMEDMKDNTMLMRSAQVCYAVLFICALEIFPPLNDLLQLTPFPETQMDLADDDEWAASIATAGQLSVFVRDLGFPVAISSLMVADIALTFLSERIIRQMFGGR